MKKHAEKISKIKSEDLNAEILKTRKDLAGLQLGVKSGDIQNYKLASLKRRELARLLTRANKERKD